MCTDIYVNSSAQGIIFCVCLFFLGKVMINIMKLLDMKCIVLLNCPQTAKEGKNWTEMELFGTLLNGLLLTYAFD